MLPDQKRRNGQFLWLICMLLLVMPACVRSGIPPLSSNNRIENNNGTITPPLQSDGRLNTVVPLNLPVHSPGMPELTPTPDLPRVLPTLRTQTEIHIVQPGETLGIIARKYGVLWSIIAEANQVENPDLVSVGQTLIIPPPQPAGTGSSYKIIPDSELVFGPASILLDTSGFIQSQKGYLKTYHENLGDENWSGEAIVTRIAREYSVNPRLLLALLEERSGWLTRTNPSEETMDYPIGSIDDYRKGLYRQLAWAANSLNRGYYLWEINAIAYWTLTDGTVFLVDPTINAGTAAVQYLFSLLCDRPAWEKIVSSDGFSRTYQQFFGSPFDYSFEPLLPGDLQQPEFQLPFNKDETWSFTGGPHAGWGDGSAWAGLDFAPPGEGAGCVSSDYWVTAVADGLIIHAENGVVVLDLDGDGYEQTGWTILYLHIETRDRVEVGQWVKAGDPIGHPSCEGGVSNGTHVHMARRYNGVWVSGDGNIPFVLSGWVSQGTGQEYDGFLLRNDQIVEAWDRKTSENQIAW